jgi:hypothetical protein
MCPAKPLVALVDHVLSPLPSGAVKNVGQAFQPAS